MGRNPAYGVFRFGPVATSVDYSRLCVGLQPAKVQTVARFADLCVGARIPCRVQVLLRLSFDLFYLFFLLIVSTGD